MLFWASLVLAGIGIGLALTALYDLRQVRKDRKELDALEDEQQDRAITDALISLHNVTEVLEALTLSMNAHPLLGLDPRNLKDISMVLSDARKALTALAGPNPILDRSHVNPAHPQAKWPYNRDGTVKL